jgi:hypothetical protein
MRNAIEDIWSATTMNPTKTSSWCALATTPRQNECGSRALMDKNLGTQLSDRIADMIQNTSRRRMA